MHHIAKFQITDPSSPQSLGHWFSKCQQKQNTGISRFEKKKNKWLPFCKYVSYGKISNYQP